MALKIIQNKPVEVVTKKLKPVMMAIVDTTVSIKTSTALTHSQNAAEFWAEFSRNGISSRDLAFQDTSGWGTIATGGSTTKVIADVSGEQPGLITHIIGPYLSVKSTEEGGTVTTFKVTVDGTVHTYIVPMYGLGRAVLGRCTSAQGPKAVEQTEEGATYSYSNPNGHNLTSKSLCVANGFGIPHEGNFKVEITCTQGTWSTSPYLPYTGVATVRGLHNYKEG